MYSDLWQRRVGWFCLVAGILFCGAVAQSRHAAAQDGNNSNAFFDPPGPGGGPPGGGPPGGSRDWQSFARAVAAASNDP